MQAKVASPAKRCVESSRPTKKNGFGNAVGESSGSESFIPVQMTPSKEPWPPTRVIGAFGPKATQ